MSKWISCKDRFPKPGLRVLVLKKYRNVEKEISYIYDLDFYMGVGNYHNWSRGGTMDSYWMELPDAPEEENE